MFADHSFNWRRVVLKQYGTPLGWISAWGLLVLWNLAQDEGGLLAQRPAVVTIASIMTAMLAFWVFARYTKKSRRWGSA